MQTGNKIRIIKRGERDRRQQQGPTRAVEKPASAGEAAVNTVTGWIGELQQKKRAEALTAARALKSLQVKAA